MYIFKNVYLGECFEKHRIAKNNISTKTLFIIKFVYISNLYLQIATFSIALFFLFFQEKQKKGNVNAADKRVINQFLILPSCLEIVLNLLSVSE